MRVACLFFPENHDQLKHQIEHVLTDKEISVRFSCVKNEYINLIKEYDNIITWGLKVPKEWYDKHGKNFLFIENALFNQGSGIFLDTNGWFSDSTICTDKEYLQSASSFEIDKFYEIAEERFGWVDYFQEYDPEGPILVVLQRENDAPVKYCYDDYGKGSSILSLLSRVKKQFPDKEIIVRPHPRHRSDWEEVREEGVKIFGDRWELDLEKSVYRSISRCSKVITINSTVATEALFSGIPVATIGRSAYTGSGATYEGKLSGFDDFTPDREVVKNYLGAIMRHQLMIDSSCEDILNNECFSRWMSNGLS
jgi:hypothetical protein